MHLNILLKHAKYITLAFFLCFNLSANAQENDESISLKAQDGLKKYKPYNCVNLVETIRDDSRRYVDSRGYSIEQIEGRNITYETDSEIKCSGIGILSNTNRYQINYKAFLDIENEWIIEYTLPN